MPADPIIASRPDHLSHAAWDEVFERLRRATSVAVLSGAGISAESGLPTFRAGGLWEEHRFEDVATPGAFRRDPALVWRFYNHRRRQRQSAAPNRGHAALVRLEQAIAGRGGAFTLITQNVDGLHAAAGSANVVELHGNLLHDRCNDCDRITPAPPAPAAPAAPAEPIDLPRCACGGLLRPNVVWFGESLPADALLRARSAADHCYAFLVVGTSAVVHPVAGLIDVARAGGALVIEVNPQPTDATPLAHAVLRGASGELLPPLIDRWLAG